MVLAGGQGHIGRSDNNMVIDYGKDHKLKFLVYEC